MTEGLIDYKCKQKDWWRNMDNIVINYRHCGEENSMYLIHMSLPKIQIDRICPDSKIWIWK